MKIIDENFLTETKLGEFLKTYFPNGNWISQFKPSNSRFKIDWYSESLKLCIEFDGYQHYTSSKQILADYRKNELCEKLEIKLIRIPYFVQLSTDVIKLLFNLDLKDFKQTYPHGFNSNKSTMIYPADYCYLGIEKFKNDFEKFLIIKNEIIDSLKKKNIDKRMLLPEPLLYLLNEQLNF